MREYLMSVIGAAVVVGVICSLMPEGEGGGLKRHVGFIGALCVLAILISPADEFLGWLDGLSEGGLDILVENERERYDRQYSQYLLTLGERELADEIVTLVCQEFDISSEQCHVKATIGHRDGKAVADQVTVILSGAALLRDPYEIEGFISQLLECECTVVG